MPEKSIRILLVEDEKNIRENIATLLNMNDFDVRATASVQEALLCLETFIPDIILCDIIMPGSYGYVLLETIKTMPGLSTIPLVFLTAKSEKFDFEKATSMGASAYLTKPFKFANLLLTINEVLK